VALSNQGNVVVCGGVIIRIWVRQLLRSNFRRSSIHQQTGWLTRPSVAGKRLLSQMRGIMFQIWLSDMLCNDSC